MIFTKHFWKDAVERMVATAAEAAILALGADQLNVLEADFQTVVGFALGGALLAGLKCVASAKSGDTGTASFVALTQSAPCERDGSCRR